jgi:hypothetical protein
MQDLDRQQAANDNLYLPSRHRTLPILASISPIANYPAKLQLPTEALPRVYDWRGNCRDLKSFWGEPKKEGDAKNLLSLFKYLLILIFMTITISSQ